MDEALADMHQMKKIVDDIGVYDASFNEHVRYAQCAMRMVKAGSRFISETVSRYVMMGIELLGVVWAVKKSKMFLQGLPEFEIVTDHKPLITILDSYHLDEIENPRLQRLRIQLLNYKFTSRWCCGEGWCTFKSSSKLSYSWI